MREEDSMQTREEILQYGMMFPDVYIDTSFHADDRVLLRCRKNRRAK